MISPRLEHLTKLSDLVKADEGAAEEDEGLGDVGAPLVADGQTAEAVEPCQRSFDNPAVPTRPFAAVHATTGNAEGATARPRQPVRQR